MAVNLSGYKPEYFVKKLSDLGRLLRDAVIQSRRANSDFSGSALSGVARQTLSDTIYNLDTQVEPELERFCTEWSREIPLLLIAEGVAQAGMPEGQACFPVGITPDQAAVQLIVDPVDGTRGLMYDKRSAWVLAGIAPNLGNAARLSDIFVAMQAEIPTSKQTMADLLWAVRGHGAQGQRENLLTGATRPLAITPSGATDLLHGFGSVVSFFPGSKQQAAELLEFIAQGFNGPPDPDRPLLFDDQYISTGGQLYEILMGHDRFVVDIRQDLDRLAGQKPGLCAHPYDLASMLVAQEAGVHLTNGRGAALDGPLDVHTSISWAACANAELGRKIVSLIAEFFRTHAIGI